MYQSYSEQSFPGILFLIAFALILGGSWYPCLSLSSSLYLSACPIAAVLLYRNAPAVLHGRILGYDRSCIDRSQTCDRCVSADPTRRAASLAAPDLWDDPQARLHKKPLLHPPQSPVLASLSLYLYLSL